MSVTEHVRERYSAGAHARQEALCCPVDYDRSLLELLPEEVVEKDYGCGDPTRYVAEGDTVLDLGSGGGKICYMAAQLVGGSGRVIGVDMNDDMLALARRYQGEMARRLGGDRVEFRKGYIQDLALDVERMESRLASCPVNGAAELEAFQAWCDQQRRAAPMIAEGSVDVVISNCVLNLVAENDRVRMIDDIFRVLRPGGRVAISDIVADEAVPAAMREDRELWTGCISGAFQEAAFLEAFRAAGFRCLAYDRWQGEPWRVVEGVEFRSVTLTAVKPAPGARWDRGQAVLYLGPYSEVRDDDGQVFPRGRRIAVCEKTYDLLRNGPLSKDFVFVQPVHPAERKPFSAAPGTERSATETKGGMFDGRVSGGGCC